MTKQEAIINISTILNRKSSNDDKTAFFESKKHDDLLDLVLQYIENSSVLVGNPKVFKTQALNDHGVDLIVEFPNGCKIGMQIKSNFDVSEKDFAVKVKAQFAESQFHGLDKWYLLICSPLKESGGKSYSSKISHLINEFSSYKTSYHAVYNPQQMVNILNGGLMKETEFRSIKNQYYFEETNWVQIIKELGSQKKIRSYLDGVSETGNKADTAGLYNKYLNMITEEEKQSSMDDLLDLFTLLKKLSKNSREFLFVCILRGKVSRAGFFDQIVVLCHDVENYLNIDQRIVKKEVRVLEDYGIAYIDDLEGDGLNYSIVVKNTNPNYNILATVKEFCGDNEEGLRTILVDLDFSYFDN
jgi:hypothetical protein